MSSSTTNSSLARSRSLRVAPSNTLKPVTASAPQLQIGPSNIALFLTNLRLLDLDLRDDWPNVTTVTFSTKDSQQNQKKRIQCVEWALYQLFALWDPEQARDKLQPFFPPLEPLQSLNLRAALFRCLDQAKENGFLGRDTVLRKTMLDECKGERLEEVLAVFSNVVLKKVLQQGTSFEHQALAQQLALENFSYTGERSVLSALIMAHKSSLSNLLRDKKDANAKYHDFGDLLDLNERRIARRHEQLKQAIEENGSADNITDSEVRSLQEQVEQNWSGNQEWLETLLYGDNRANADGVLATRFEKIWSHVEAGSIGEIEGIHKVGLLEQLDARVKDQENRLARWQDFGKTLCRPDGSSPSKKPVLSAQQQKIELGFTRHQALQIGRAASENRIRPATASLDEYSRLIENMKSELAGVGKSQPPSKRPVRHSLVPDKGSSPSPSTVSMQQESATAHDEEWSSASDNDDVVSPSTTSYATKSTSRTPPSQGPVNNSRGRPAQRPPSPVQEISTNQSSPIHAKEVSKNTLEPIVIPEDRSPSPLPLSHTPPPLEPPKPNVGQESESDLADHILNSISATSPSPKKTRHTLSLAERTRLSMSRASHSRLSDLHDEFEVAELPRLTLKSRPSMAVRTVGAESDSDKHADLIERTRKSMAGFEAAQKKAQLERRKSVKDAKKKQRESSYFPKVEEEVVTPDISTIEMLEGDPDYESVFKSRPKIKTSPAVSPTRIWEESED
ncbi:uncharacterized protein LY89DRAFT_656392 [Mollisia scopiformis]|uniref:HAUS augmin-like complex subunit 6 N-terminal domain-containing protein n=1 Tax=Mollisia scopiformis TaxID=149040 RepID=A0A132BDU0_MOLSC|nr:uncharacterized protein LY89DRAFT_656392 [Mollisia scopiformis]KUJ10551.1 hypothetical protein LY89DRAFT_656392 [Mollisia scopiformis]